MKKTILSLLFTVIFAVPAYSQMMDRDMKGGPKSGHEQMMEMGSMDRMGDMMGMCLEHATMLGLTDEQFNNLRTIHRTMQKKQVRFKADQKIAEIEFMEIMDVKDFDMEKAKVAIQQRGEMRTAHNLDMLKNMKEVRAILTEEQFNKMKKMMPMMKDGKKPEKMMKKHKGHK